MLCYKLSRNYDKEHRQVLSDLVAKVISRIDEVDVERSAELLKVLCKVTYSGKMPSFSDGGARSGYILRRFIPRSSYIGQILMHGLCQDILYSLVGHHTLSIASLGGGAGSDYTGMLYFLRFLRTRSSLHGIEIESNVKEVNCRVFEYEAGWKDSVSALNAVVPDYFTEIEGSVSFSSGDVNLPLSSSINHDLSSTSMDYDVFIFSYVLIENALSLAESDYIFIRDIFNSCRETAVFIFVDSSYKLWDHIHRLAVQVWGEGRVNRVQPTHRAFGNTMLLTRYI